MTPIPPEVKLLDMSPGLSALDLVDQSYGNAVLRSDLHHSAPVSANGRDVGASQLGIGALVAIRGAAHSSPPSIHINGIIRGSSPPKMVGVYARRIIARMQSPFARLWGAAGDGKSNVGGSPWGVPAVRQEYAKLAVTVSAFCASPRPALFGLADHNLGPKSLQDRGVDRGYKVDSHGAGSLRGGQGRRLLEQLFRPVFLTTNRGSLKGSIAR